jgi:hypothetical protein
MLLGGRLWFYAMAAYDFAAGAAAEPPASLPARVTASMGLAPKQVRSSGGCHCVTADEAQGAALRWGRAEPARGCVAARRASTPHPSRATVQAVLLSLVARRFAAREEALRERHAEALRAALAAPFDPGATASATDDLGAPLRRRVQTPRAMLAPTAAALWSRQSEPLPWIAVVTPRATLFLTALPRYPASQMRSSRGTG